MDAAEGTSLDGLGSRHWSYDLDAAEGTSLHEEVPAEAIREPKR